MTLVLHAVALALYAFAALLFVASLVREASRLSPFATATAGAAAATHAAALAVFLSQWGELPLVGLGPSLSTLAFLIAVGSLIVSLAGRVGPVGLVLVPVVALLVGTALLVGIEPVGEAQTYQSVWFVLHVLLAFVGYAGLTMAFAAGLMYLVQFRQLKDKRFGAIFRFFPPLDTLDRIGARSLLVAFPALTVALLLATAWVASFPEPVAARNPHIVWGVLTWGVILAALLARSTGGRRGHRGALASVVGFVVVVLAFLLLRVYSPQSGAFL